MTLPVFPVDLPGLSYESSKTPEFSTSIHTSANGCEVRGLFRIYPLWRFKLNFKYLRAEGQNGHHEYEALQGFFLNAGGAFRAFRFLDPTDHVCTDAPFGAGDGVQKDFQLTRPFGFNGGFPFTEPISTPKNITTIAAVLGGTTTHPAYTLKDDGLVSFTSPPAAGAILSWSGEFYYRCRFKEDTIDLNRFFPKLWKVESLEFVGSMGLKI
jgi:uncharacterized protein (TIGR02217 family)